ncbi:hypothetical protein SOJ40_19625, partial [Acinetobacter baumannii]|nr:hypothetical protein [Acinetobacter baumannii]
SNPKTVSVDGIKVLIGIFLNHTQYINVVEDASNIICQLIDKHKDTLIKENKDGTINFNLPYDKIADEIYNHKQPIFFDSLDVFVNTVYSYIETKHDSKILISYRKFTRHILLAVRQKNFINEVTKDAKDAANLASKVANDASVLAINTESEIKNSVVNYITILGIFATIIFALFGGVNLVSAINNLLASEHRPRLTTIMFLMSALVLTISTLLVLLMTWLNEVKGLGEAKWKNKMYLKIYFGIIGVCLLIMILSACRLM